MTTWTHFPPMAVASGHPWTPEATSGASLAQQAILDTLHQRFPGDSENELMSHAIQIYGWFQATHPLYSVDYADVKKCVTGYLEETLAGFEPTYALCVTCVPYDQDLTW